MGSVGGEFFTDHGGLFQFRAVAHKLLFLIIQTAEQGQYFHIGVPIRIFHGFIQIQRIDGLDDSVRQPGCKNKGNGKSSKKNPRQGKKEAQEKVPDRNLRDREAQNSSVGKLLSGIELPLKKRRRVSAALSVSVTEGIADLFSFHMVFHDRGVHLIVVEDRSVAGDPGDSEIRRPEVVKIVHAASFDGLRDKFGLAAELSELLIGKVRVHQSGDQNKSDRHHKQEHEPDRLKDFTAHRRSL